MTAAPLSSRDDDPVAGALQPLVWLLLPLTAVARPATVVAVGLAAGACVPLAWLTGGPSFCPFKVLTGLPCPGCGLTRGTVALLHGDLATSFHFHPLALPLVLAMVAVALADAWVWRQSATGGRTGPSHAWVMERVMQSSAPWVAIGVLALVWVVRLPLYVAGVWTF
ncbi:MAG: DUF2752 domain-containing protein [Chloroflexota bacterium]